MKLLPLLILARLLATVAFVPLARISLPSIEVRQSPTRQQRISWEQRLKSINKGNHNVDSSAEIPPFDRTRFQAGTLARKLVRASRGAILVDVENVRGKSGFQLNHREIYHSLAIWSRICELQGQVTLVVDHGSEQVAYYIEKDNLCIVFAGPSAKADDVIARDVAFLGQASDVLIVTADQGLIDRCRRSAVQKTLSILPPLTLLQDIEYILRAVPIQIETTTDGDEQGENLNLDADGEAYLKPSLKALDHEIKLGAELLEAEAQLRTKSGVNNKRRGKLKSKIRILREKLAKSPSLLDQVVDDVLHRGPRSLLLTKQLPREQQGRLLARWEAVRKTSMRKEKTGDRVILAEQWRRQLEQEQQTKHGDDDHDSAAKPTTMAMAHAFKYTLQRPDVSVPHANKLRIVVVSDTHRYESSLMSVGNGGNGLVGNVLPDGDVLLHLGDFAIDGSQQKLSVARFDEWLAAQPHTHKIVLRGNHDPRTWYPVQSGANFITQPATLTIGNFIFAMIPYMASGSVSNRLMPRRCHVLCTHIPPHNILDQTYSGKHAGSSTLRKGAERMAKKNSSPPALWLCGHIHEARGVMRHDFTVDKSSPQVGGTNQNGLDTDRETLVINAANANSGIAERLDYGPLVLELTMDENKKNKKPNVEIISMDHQYEFLNIKNEAFFETQNGSSGGPAGHQLSELLLAVDLGLQTGFALYNQRGRLLIYENVEYQTKEELHHGALEVMRRWEAEFQDGSDASICSRITHVAIEGADVELRQVWKDIWDACRDNGNLGGSGNRKHLLFVRPEEWRADLLISKEKQSGEKAKEAARQIARQIVADYSDLTHNGKFPTDVAESVLVGYHVCRRLGWSQREPAIRRYTNGKVIVPTSLASSAPAARAAEAIPEPASLFGTQEKEILSSDTSKLQRSLIA